MSPIHCEYGYEIYHGDGKTLLINRQTWPLVFAIGLLGGLAVVMTSLGLVVLLGTSSGPRLTAESAVPLGLAMALLVALGAMWRTYTYRRDLPPVEVTDGIVINSSAGVLRNREGDVLSQLDSVRAAVRIDWWWTRGLMRLVVLTWPGGRRVVFRTASRQRAREVVKTLLGIGIGEPPR